MIANLHALSKNALIGSRDAAAYLRCSAAWLAVLRMRQAGPTYVKHGNWVRYRVSDLDAWTEQHRVRGATETAA